ncbi:histidine phosphatase family protein [Liquorilactobacillus nagelii]|uniref:histidine phosphatase family protein n=1 Tax=Liquorilactobacillus nagelii TaxID=82688 RepID=UPI00070AB0F6|nr:histidine phosphatase family protein [Liquorilactobacillus nagelii]QYH55523.1 histidine phosphatase family protein [Liquorilactobacillus nagelii DSM 13675]
MTILYIIRHGQSQANAKGILQGSQIDTPLTSKGKKQAETVGVQLKQQKINFDLVYASPLLRAAQTAAIIAPKLTTVFDNRLKEFDYGSWDGELKKIIWQKFPDCFDLRHNLLPGTAEINHGENFAQVTFRLQQLFAELVEHYPTKKILIASHGFTIKLMLNAVLGINRLSSLNEPTNAGLTKIELTSQTQTVYYFNRDLTTAN